MKMAPGWKQLRWHKFQWKLLLEFRRGLPVLLNMTNGSAATGRGPMNHWGYEICQQKRVRLRRLTGLNENAAHTAMRAFQSWPTLKLGAWCSTCRGVTSVEPSCIDMPGDVQETLQRRAVRCGIDRGRNSRTVETRLKPEHEQSSRGLPSKPDIPKVGQRVGINDCKVLACFFGIPECSISAASGCLAAAPAEHLSPVALITSQLCG